MYISTVTTPPTSVGQPSGLSGGAITGIIVAVLVVTMVLAVVAILTFVINFCRITRRGMFFLQCLIL